MQRIAVISGKGGVGKSVISVSLAVALRKKGFKVGVLDADLTGSNIPDILGMQGLKVIDDMLIASVNKEHEIRYISLGQIASEGDPVLWEGKDLASASRQLLEKTKWGPLDFLVVDFPPGTESEVQSLLPVMDYALIITVPSVLAESKVKRIVECCRETQTPILGLIKNMTRFVCPSCNQEYRIFPENHDFEDLGIPTIAEIPLDPKVAAAKLINDFPIDAVVDAMKHPVLLKKRKKSLKRRLMAFLLKKGKGF